LLSFDSTFFKVGDGAGNGDRVSLKGRSLGIRRELPSDIIRVSFLTLSAFDIGPEGEGLFILGSQGLSIASDHFTLPGCSLIDVFEETHGDLWRNRLSLELMLKHFFFSFELFVHHGFHLTLANSFRLNDVSAVEVKRFGDSEHFLEGLTHLVFVIISSESASSKVFITTKIPIFVFLIIG
jgi:hypothetical protein